MFSIKLAVGQGLELLARTEAHLKTAYSVYWYPYEVACIIQCRLLAVKIFAKQLCGIANVSKSVKKLIFYKVQLVHISS